jgi:cell division protein FtsL
MDNVLSRTYVHTDILGQQVIRERAIPVRQEFKNYMLVAIALVFSMLLFVWSRTQMVQMGYEVSQANKIYQGYVSENQQLRVEVASLRAPSRIEALAKSQLGFVTPKAEQIILVP